MERRVSSPPTLRRHLGISVVGAVVDVCQKFGFPVAYGRKILITLHRRENFGERIEFMLRQIEELARNHPDLEFVFPMHPNPELQRHRHLLGKTVVTPPLRYRNFLELLS